MSRDFAYAGSSPRMRGAGAGDSLTGRLPGIIPAHAGSSSSQGFGGLVYEDHPRACGEQAATVAATKRRVGSSPRMRGAARCRRYVSGGRRIIPAHAGSREISSRSESAMQDHPRACGEQINITNYEMLDRGSSPRMRGAVRVAKPGAYLLGIIPAHAGSRCLSPRCYMS